MLFREQMELNNIQQYCPPKEDGIRPSFVVPSDL
jgi:hypothetical protein